MYRRRRAVALVIVLAAVSLVVFCVYSLGRGVVDGMSLLRPTPIARESVPAPKKTSGVNDCGASDVKLSLTAASQGVSVGGSLDFTASIRRYTVRTPAPLTRTVSCWRRPAT